MFKQGKPDGPNDHYQVHLLDLRTETIIRDDLLSNKQARARCGNGSWHKWFASKPEEITCPRCREISNENSDNSPS